MSRCVPYPPPRYETNGFSGVALIKPIKLQSKSLNIKTDQSDEKKKRRRIEGKEKGKKIENVCGQSKKLDSDIFGAEPEEKSDLSEEHGQPFFTQSLNYLSDGTQSTDTRKRENPSSSCGCQRNATGIKIRISLKRHREPGASISKEPICSTSGRADLPVQQSKSANTKTNVIIPEVRAPLPDQKLHSSPHGARTPSGSYNTEVKRFSSLYKSLIEDWVPPLLQCNQDGDDDQDWLFGTKKPETSRAKRSKVDNDVLCASSPSSLLPRARYLPESDTWALPYTVPF